MLSRNKIYIFSALLISLILLAGLSFGQTAEKTRYFVEPTITLKPFQQKAFVVEVENEETDTLFQVLSKEGIPISYYRKITTEVCFDDKCRLLKANIFWNITGRYLGVELPEDEFLSKTDHEPFTLGEYNRLNHLLADSLLPLGTLQYEDLVPPTYSIGTLDAVTGATSKDVLEYVVQGAVYTTYTLWHIVYGSTQKEIMQLTEKALTPDLLIKILESREVGDKYWALRRMEQDFLVTSEELRNEVVALIDESDYSLAEAAIGAFGVQSLRSEVVQNHLYSKFESSAYNLRKRIVQKFNDAPKLSSEIKFGLAKRLGELNGGLLVDVFTLFTKHQVNDQEILAMISKLLKDPNRFKATQASKYLNSLEKMTSAPQANNWQAKWIAAAGSRDTTNSWFAFRKDFHVDKIPRSAIANIAVDSKYWMTINGEMVVFEGGLKRGPNSQDTYFDQIDIAPFLKIGQNTISIKLWYFGKEGFSHKSSGKAALIFDCQGEEFSLLSDTSWNAWPLIAYQTAPEPHPNFRLPESSILYDARLEYAGWETADHFALANKRNAVEIGAAGISPWNKLVLRPIPFWKDFGLKDYPSAYERRGDTIICSLPYNAQFTPYFKINAKAGQRIVLVTDNYLHYNGSDDNIRAEYITKEGIQEYESVGWLNGHKMYYILPKGVEIIDLKYRETGYNTEFVGSFSSDDPFLNKLWNKARRTLYVTMRDTYMDCPDRERAQWTGDAVLEAEEAFYALSPSSHLLAKKWLHEIIGWQREDGSLFAPVPAGNWSKELPGQVLTTVGYYGIWTYYQHTADLNTIKELYPGIQRYLDLWEFDEKGLVKIREGGWNWGDWGENKDMLLIYNLWYYLAMKGNYLMAMELNKSDDAQQYLEKMSLMKKEFNARFWNGESYRNPGYEGETDDRVHALAILSGVADADKYPQIMKVFSQEEHASPYMEKFVFEAMYQMGFPAEANKRHEKRFSEMVNNDYFTTLFEGWGIGNKGYGGGTVNHAWSGGGLTILSSYLCGIRPLKPGYKVFAVAPQPGSVKNASAEIISVAGKISAAFRNEMNKFNLSVEIPEDSEGLITLPPNAYKAVSVNGRRIFNKGVATRKSGDYEMEIVNDLIQIKLGKGHWKIDSSYK